VVKQHLKEVLKQGEEEDSGLISALLNAKAKPGTDPMVLQRIKAIAESLLTNDTIED